MSASKRPRGGRKPASPRRARASRPSGRPLAEPRAGAAGAARGVYNVRDFGAAGNGTAKDTAAIAAAISAAGRAGGGTVFLPAGRYLTGTIALASHITLHLDSGAAILGSPDPADYPILPAGTVAGLDEDVRQSLIWALDCRDIAIVGRGTIDGQGAQWWALRAAEGPKRLRETLRPRMIELLRCTNVRLAEITCRNSASWTIHPLVCDNVAVDGVTVCNPPDSPNTDGINPEACSNVRIANCHIDVGDDCITIKSGTETQPLRSSRPCENITVTGCTMLHGHGGVVIGSEMAGGVRHVTVGNCVFDGTDRGLRIKTRRGRGSAVEHVSVSNVVMRSVRSVVHVTMFYTGTHLDPAADAHRVAPEPVGSGTPRVRDIHLANIVAADCHEVGYLAGLPEMPIEGVAMTNVCVSAGRACFAARVKGLTLRDVDVTVAAGPALVCEDCQDLDVAHLRDRSGDAAAPTIELTNVTDAALRDCRPRAWGRLAHVAGRGSGRIVVGPNPLAQGERVVTLSDGAAGAAVTRL